MYRIFILSLLAIVSSTFALEPSQVILRATEIRGDSMVLEWSPIDGAKSYKVIYDEENLINPKAPEPILESPSTEAMRLELEKMMEGTAYYLIVHAFNEKGEKIGQTLPLHASTLRNPMFTLRSSATPNDQSITLVFSHPIDLKNTQIEIMNTETKKLRTIKEIQLSENDLRIVNLKLEGKLAPDMSHDIVLKKVTNTSGGEMLPESRKTTTIVFSQIPEATEEISEESPTTERVLEEAPITIQPELTEVSLPNTSPDKALDALQDKTEELGIDRVEASFPLEEATEDKMPVPIDTLPQTGASSFIIIFFAVLCGMCLSYKKKTLL